MLVVLDVRLFDDPEVRELELLALLLHCVRRRHHGVVTDPLLDADSPPQVVRWLAGQRPSVGTELRRYLVEVAPDLAASSRADKRRIRVEPREHSRWEGPMPALTVSDAIRLVTRPLGLLVEDRISDFSFLRAAAPPQWRDALDQARTEGSLEPEHGGGITSMKARVLDAATAPDPIERARLWVMCDSDRRAPDEPNAHSEALIEVCRSTTSPWPIPCRQLRRRSIENYLPISWLRRWPDVSKPHHKQAQQRNARERAVKVIERRLDALQRAHYNFKHGLLGDILTDKKAKKESHRRDGTAIGDDDLHRLFRGLSVEDRRALHDGLGHDVASMFGFSPDKRSRHGLEDAELVDALPHDEIEALLTSIFDGI
jgi:hypothetical protein